MGAEKFMIRGAGEEWGELSLDQLHRMLSRVEIEAPVEYLHPGSKKWRPIAGIMFDLEPGRLESLRGAGIKSVEILGGGDGDCEHCLALQDRIIPIEAAPPLPPERCSCIPWCRLCVIAVE